MNILVLAGGVSMERDVSLVSGDKVSKALRRKGHNAFLVDSYLGYSGDEPVEEIFSNSEKYSPEVSDIKQVAPDIAEVKHKREGERSFFGPRVLELCKAADIVFIALHGENGENGRVQAVFDLEGIKYTGSGYLPCAIAMDKGLTKTMFMTAEVPTPNGITISSKDYYNDFHYTGIGVPCVVKPCNGGSSIGVSIVKNREDYDKALKEAFEYDSEVIVEEYIKGREFAVAVLDGEALPIIEIAPKEGFYDYKNKYTSGNTIETCPAAIPENVTKEMQRQAKAAAEVLGLEAYCRMDFLLDDDENIYCLEANTLPGLTPLSLMPQEAGVAGISYDELIERIIKASLRRFEG